MGWGMDNDTFVFSLPRAHNGMIPSLSILKLIPKCTLYCRKKNGEIRPVRADLREGGGGGGGRGQGHRRDIARARTQTVIVQKTVQCVPPRGAHLNIYVRKAALRTKCFSGSAGVTHMKDLKVWLFAVRHSMPFDLVGCSKHLRTG